MAPSGLTFTVTADANCALSPVGDTLDISTLTTYLLGPNAEAEPSPVVTTTEAGTTVHAVAWIDQDGTAGMDLEPPAADFGRVMLTRFTVVTDRVGVGVGIVGEGSNVVRLTGAGADKFTSGTLVSANDNVVWVGDEDGTGTGGAFGRDAQAIALINGDTIVTWVDADGSITGKAYAGSASEDADELGGAAASTPSSLLNELLSSVAQISPEQKHRLVETGRDSFAILWAATLAGAVVIQGRHFAAPDEQGGEWNVSEVPSANVGPAFGLATDFQVLGWSDEAGVVTVSYEIDGDAAPVVQRLAFDASASEATLSTAGQPGGSAQTFGSSSSFGLSLKPIAAQSDAAELGASAESTSPAKTGFASLHAGIVEDANLIVADNADSRLVGTEKNDVILADTPDAGSPGDAPIAGGNDVIEAGLGNDVIYGGGGNDAIDGGSDSADQPATDTAIFTGDSRSYSITVNGDGSYTVVLASSDTGTEIDRSADGFEGIDVVDDIEQYQFLNGDSGYLAQLVDGADITTLDTSGHGVVLESDLYSLPDHDTSGGSGAHDGTPTAWGLSRDEDGNVENSVEVATITEDGGSSSGADGSSVVSAMSDGGFAVGYVDGDELHVTSYDALGRQDGSATSSVAIDTTTSPVMDAAGDGVAIAYVTAGPDGSIGVEVIDLENASCGHADGTIAVNGDVSDLAIAGSEDGGVVNVAWVESSDGSSDSSGDIVVQRLESSDDDETALVEAGLDGEAGAGSDGAETIGAGRAPAITETDDDGFAVAWVGEGESQTEQIEGRVFDSSGLAVETFILPVGTNRHLREGSGPTLETTGDGDLFIAWEEVDDDAGGLAIMSALLRQLGPSEWSYPIIRELRKFDDEPSEISIAVAGENGDAIIVTWRNDGDGGGEIIGQRYSVDAIAEGATEIAVGVAFEVAAAGNDGESRDNVSIAGLDDGRVVVVTRETEKLNDDAAPVITVQATLLDTRDPADVLIGDDQGAAQDTHVGTIGNDVVDGRANADELYGALGDDVLTGGTGNDRLDGGDGNDTLIAGSGTDHLDGGDGDDVLMGGFGRDYIHGGDGDDTLSYRGETRSVTVDLAAGIVRSDAAYNAVVTPSQSLDVRGISTATLFDSGVEDILGRLESTNRGSDGGVEFYSGHGIENVEGGLGSDDLSGDGSNNVLTGGKGDDLLDGRDGDDTAAFTGNAADYDFEVLANGSVTVHHARNTSSAANDGTDTLRNIEAVTFADGSFELQSDGTLSPASIAAAFGIVSEISVAAIECFDFTDLDEISDEHGSSGSGTSGYYGSSGSSSLTAYSAAELCGLGSDTLYFGDLDALYPAIQNGKDYDDLFDDDGLDYGSCTVFASSAEIEAAMCLDGPDSLDAMTTIDHYLSKTDSCDPTEFRLG